MALKADYKQNKKYQFTCLQGAKAKYFRKKYILKQIFVIHERWLKQLPKRSTTWISISYLELVRMILMIRIMNKQRHTHLVG